MPAWGFASALVQAAGDMAIEGGDSLAPALLNLVDRVMPYDDPLANASVTQKTQNSISAWRSQREGLTRRVDLDAHDLVLNITSALVHLYEKTQGVAELRKLESESRSCFTSLCQ